MAMMAISIGKIAVMRLKASADAKPITQSLLNLVKKSRRVFALSLAAHSTPEVLCCSAPVAMASLSSGFSILTRYRAPFRFIIDVFVDLQIKRPLHRFGEGYVEKVFYNGHPYMLHCLHSYFHPQAPFLIDQKHADETRR